MKNADKNRDPERARKRAVADARCALRKLGWLSSLEEWPDMDERTQDAVACAMLDDLATLLVEGVQS